MHVDGEVYGKLKIMVVFDATGGHQNGPFGVGVAKQKECY